MLGKIRNFWHVASCRPLYCSLRSPGVSQNDVIFQTSSIGILSAYVTGCVPVCYEIIHSVAANVWTLTATAKLTLHVTRAICDEMPSSQISSLKLDVPTW